MGYIQDKLKEALGGNKVMDTKNSVIHDWTPNNVKVLVISRNYILVIYHIGGFGGSKLVKLDLEQVKLDLDRILKSGVSSKLNTILKRRSFSCMEEIYIDSIYMSNPPIIDLLGYAGELISTTSRLRYFGYGDFPLGSDEYIRLAYQNNKKCFDYSLAKDSNKPIKLEYRDVKNNDWYKNYYLRPKYYRLDEEKGKLAIHFRKFEEDYKTYLSSKDKDKSEKELEEGLRYIACINDRNNVVYLRKFDTLLYYLSKGNGDNIRSTILKICIDRIRNGDIFEGLTYSVASNILADNNEKDYLLKSYERFGVLDKGSNNINKSKVGDYVREGRGFINLNYILDVLCTETIKVLSSKGYKDLVGMALIVAERDIPQGILRENFIKKSTNEGSLDGYFSLLSEIIGVVL